MTLKSRKFALILLEACSAAAFVSASVGLAQQTTTPAPDPLIQARQSYRVASQNQSVAQSGVDSATAAASIAQSNVTAAQTQSNSAQTALQTLIQQDPQGDTADLQNTRAQLQTQVNQTQNVDLPNLQNITLPQEMQAAQQARNNVDFAQGQLRDANASVDQKSHALDAAKGAVQSAQNALQPYQGKLAQDRQVLASAQQAAQVAGAALVNGQNAVTQENSAVASDEAQINRLPGVIASDQAAVDSMQTQIATTQAMIKAWANPHTPPGGRCVTNPSDSGCKDADSIKHAQETWNTDLSNKQKQMAPMAAKLKQDQDALTNARASLVQAQANLTSDQAQIPGDQQRKAQADASVQAAERQLASDAPPANLTQALDQANRTFQQAQRDVQIAQDNVGSARRQLQGTMDALTTAQQTVQQTRTQIQNDQQYLQQAQTQFSQIDTKQAQLASDHQAVANASVAVSQAVAAATTANAAVTNAQTALSAATQATSTAGASLDAALTVEPILYGVGAGGISMSEPYAQVSQEISAAIAGPDSSNEGETVYAPGITILWGTAGASAAGADAMILRSPNDASALAGYAGALTVPASGSVAATTLAVGSPVAVDSTESPPGKSLMNRLYNAFEVPAGAASVDCVQTLACSAQLVGGHLVLTLPSAILVVDTTNGDTLRTVGLLNSKVLATDPTARALAISIVAAQ